MTADRQIVGWRSKAGLGTQYRTEDMTEETIKAYSTNGQWEILYATAMDSRCVHCGRKFAGGKRRLQAGDSFYFCSDDCEAEHNAAHADAKA